MTYFESYHIKPRDKNLTFPKAVSLLKTSTNYTRRGRDSSPHTYPSRPTDPKKACSFGRGPCARGKPQIRLDNDIGCLRRRLMTLKTTVHFCTDKTVRSTRQLAGQCPAVPLSSFARSAMAKTGSVVEGPEEDDACTHHFRHG